MNNFFQLNIFRYKKENAYSTNENNRNFIFIQIIICQTNIHWKFIEKNK